MDHNDYLEVLLQGVVDEFQSLIGRFGEHAVAAGSEVYQQPCVYLSFHLVQMRAGGWRDVDFDQLAAVSGASALFAYEPGEFMPKYANLHIGMDRRIADATGFGYEWVDFADAEEAWELLKETIDSGRSVKGWDWENILFCGYRDAAKPGDRRVFAIADGPDTYAKWVTWKEFGEWVKRVQEWGCPQLGRHTERVDTKDPKEVALRVCKDLVLWSANPPEAITEKYPKPTFGLAGIEKYAAECAKVDEYEDWVPCHDINPQWTIRNSTAVYLKRAAEADVFSEDVDKHLLGASEEYRAAYDKWKRLYELLGHNVPEAERRTKERRVAGSEAVLKALEHEKTALGELKETLAIVEKE